MNFAILGEIGAKPISIGIGWHTHFGLVEIQEVTQLYLQSHVCFSVTSNTVDTKAFY